MTPPQVQAFPACDQAFTITEPNPQRPWTPNAVTLVSEEVADGVFAVYDANAKMGEPAGFPLATSGGFIVGKNGVLLVETMFNRQLLCQVIDLVRAETNLPVLYAVNTGHHSDHNFGNTFLPEEVEIVQHERTASYLAAKFDQEIAFAEGSFGTDQGFDEAKYVAADIEVTDAGWSVDLGGITVETKYYGFGQSEGDLFVFVPEANVLFTGNPLTASAPAIPWLLAGGASKVAVTLASVQGSLTAGAIVVPGHGQPTNADAFTFSIDYLNALVPEVEASIGAGNDLEMTQSVVSMDDFQGYALWGFAHTSVNVANTYNELSP